MGVLFDRSGTGLTDSGDPMTEQELALLLSAMGGGGGGITNMMRNLFARKTMKNRSSARADLTRQGVQGAMAPGSAMGGMIPPQARSQGGPQMSGNRASGGGFSLGLGQSGGGELAQLLAMMKQGSAGAGSPGGAATSTPFPSAGGSALTRPQVPPIPQSRTSSQTAPGMLGVLDDKNGASSNLSSAGAGAISVPSSRYSPNPGKRVKEFYTVTPQKIQAIQKMLLSQDQALQGVGKAWLTAVASGPKPKDQYLTTPGGPILDIYNQRWLIPPVKEKTEVDQLKPGQNIVIITRSDGTQVRSIIDVPEKGDYQLVLGVSTDPITGIETKHWIRVDKNTSTGEPVTVNGKSLEAGSNITITGELSKSTIGKWADKAAEAELNLKRMNHLKIYIPDLVKTLTFQGKALFALQDVMAGLGIPQSEDYYKKVKGVAAAWDVTNKYIKLITGAQMSEREATRLMKAIPNPADNPEEFQAKFDTALELAQITYDHWHEVYQRHIAEGMSSDEAGEQAQDDIADEVSRRIDEFEQYSPWSR